MRVIVSLTTIPGRIHKLQPMLTSLLRQTQKVDKIVVNVPAVYKKWPDAATVHIPGFMVHPRIVVNRRCEDHGPITKVLGTIPYLEKGALYIYIDDDHVYPPTLVDSHIRAHQVCPRTVFVGRGSIMDKTTHIRTLMQAALMHSHWFHRVHTADGVQGVSLYVDDLNWTQLTQDALAWHSEVPLSVSADDIVLSHLFWQQGLAIRIAPMVDPAIPLKHAGDDFALCNNSDTTQRYWDVIGERTDWLEVPCAPYITPSTAAHGPVGIAVFAYQRPHLLERVLASLVPQAGDTPIHLFLDGVVHPTTGVLEGSVALWHQNLAIYKAHAPDGVVHASPTNLGVGVMQHRALQYMAAHYDYVIMLEDDLILGPNYIASLWNMRTLCDGAVGSVQAGYRKEHGEPHLLQLTRAAVEHVHYWGWMTSAKAYARMQPWYDSAVRTLFEGQYYRRRDFKAIQQWFAKHNIANNGHYSQDWVRDACFQLAGMPFKLYTPCRRGVPVGRVGLHSSSAMFDAMKLDDSTADVQRVPALDLQKATLTWDRTIPIQVVSSVMPSVLGPPCTVYGPLGISATLYITNRRLPILDLMKQITERYSTEAGATAPCSEAQS